MSFKLILLICAAAAFIYGVYSNQAGKTRSGRVISFVALVVFFCTLIFVAGFFNTAIAFLATVMIGSIQIGQTTRAVWCKPVAALSGLIGMIAAVTNIALNTDQTHADVTVPQSEVNISIKAGGFGIGKYLASQTMPDILIIYDSEMSSTITDAFLAGLEQGLTGSLAKISKAMVLLGDPDAATVDESWQQVERDKYLSVIKNYPSKKFVIVMTPLPIAVMEYYLELVESDPEAKVPKFLFFNTPLNEMIDYFGEEFLLALVTEDPNPRVYDSPTATEANLEELFAKRYLLIQQNNVSEMRASYPVIFR